MFLHILIKSQYFPMIFSIKLFGNNLIDTNQNIYLGHLLICPFLGIFGPVLGCVPLFLENHSIFSCKIWCGCSWYYSHSHHADFFFRVSFSTGGHLKIFLGPFLVCSSMFNSQNIPITFCTEHFRNTQC